MIESLQSCLSLFPKRRARDFDVSANCSQQSQQINEQTGKKVLTLSGRLNSKEKKKKGDFTFFLKLNLQTVVFLKFGKQIWEWGTSDFCRQIYTQVNQTQNIFGILWQKRKSTHSGKLSGKTEQILSRTLSNQSVGEHSLFSPPASCRPRRTQTWSPPRSWGWSCSLCRNLPEPESRRCRFARRLWDTEMRARKQLLQTAQG